MIDAGIRETHPCKTLTFTGKRSKEIIIEDLFSQKELELLLEREERYSFLTHRNKAIISLLIYQGAALNELERMKLEDVDFDKGLFRLRGTRLIRSRKLEFHPRQYRIFEKYIFEERKLLEREKTDAIFINKVGTPLLGDSINSIIESAKGLFPDRVINPKIIRKSVVSIWLNEKGIPLEQAQLMAGHKWISTTIRYRQQSTDKQRELINRFHPLG